MAYIAVDVSPTLRVRYVTMASLDLTCFSLDHSAIPTANIINGIVKSSNASRAIITAARTIGIRLFRLPYAA